jgi:hypothetical protein
MLATLQATLALFKSLTNLNFGGIWWVSNSYGP